MVGRLDIMSPRSSAPENPSRIGLDHLKHHPEVGGRRQGLVDVPFLVPVLEKQRPFAVSLAVPDSGDFGLGPDGLVFPARPLLEQGDGHSLGDISDANLVLDVLGNQAHAILVEMGFGLGSDGIWNGHCAPEKVSTVRVGFGGWECQGGLNFDAGVEIDTRVHPI